MALEQSFILMTLVCSMSVLCSYSAIWLYGIWHPKLHRWLKENTEQSLAEFLIYMPASLFWTRFSFVLAPLLILIWLILSIGYAIGFGGGVLVSTIFVKKFLIARRLTKVNEQLPNALDLLITAISAGMSFHAALEQTATKLPRPIQQEWLQIVRRERTGDGINSALQNFYQRVKTEPVLLFVLTVQLGIQHGAQQADVLRRLAQALRQQHYAIERVKSLSAQARMQGKVMLLLPIGLFATLHFLHPENTKTLLETFAGNLLLIGCAMLMVIGHVLVRKVLGSAYAR